MPRPIRVVFLDWGGVLFPASVADRPAGVAIDSLNELCADPDVAVVIVSSGRDRGLDHCAALMREWGYTGRMVGTTPMLGDEGEFEPMGPLVRGVEIMTWLQRSPWPVEGFVVLDDKPVGKEGAEPECRRIHINEWHGLSHAYLDEARQILRRPLRA